MAILVNDIQQKGTYGYAYSYDYGYNYGYNYGYGRYYHGYYDEEKKTHKSFLEHLLATLHKFFTIKK